MKINKVKECFILFMSALSCIFFSSCGNQGALESKEYNYKEVKNPVHVIANDPWVVRRDDNFYYCTADDGINVRRIENLDDLKLKGASRVWSPPKDTLYSKEIWAPELHYIKGEWYIYFAACDGLNEHHRMYVLKGTTQNPMDPFEYIGKVMDDSDHWGIDGTIMEYHDELYMIWSGWEGEVDKGQQLYIAHMDSPTSIDSERICISVPDQEWEMNGMEIEEGPTALVDKEQDTAIIVFSASGSWTDDYCMGQLTLTGKDPMKADSWTKSDKPIFTKKDGAYGPGHCSFVTAYDDSLWMIYHCNRLSGTGWGGRSAWIQPVEWDGEKLNLGEPQTPEKTILLPEKE